MNKGDILSHITGPFVIEKINDDGSLVVSRYIADIYMEDALQCPSYDLDFDSVLGWIMCVFVSRPENKNKKINEESYRKVLRGLLRDGYTLPSIVELISFSQTDEHFVRIISSFLQIRNKMNGVSRIQRVQNKFQYTIAKRMQEQTKTTSEPETYEPMTYSGINFMDEF